MRELDELHQPKNVGSVSIELATQPCRIALRCIEGGPSKINLSVPPNDQAQLRTSHAADGPSAAVPCWANSTLHHHAGLSLEDRLEVFELFKEMPNVPVRSVGAVRMQIGKGWVVTVAVESLLRGPLNQYEDITRRNVTRGSLTEFSQRHNAPTVSFDFLR